MEEQEKRGTTLNDYFNNHGHFPSTVNEIHERRDGLTLRTIDADSDSDILTFDDGTPAKRRGELA